MIARLHPTQSARAPGAAPLVAARRPGGPERLRPLAHAIGNRAFRRLIARQMGDVKLADRAFDVAERKRKVLAALKLNYKKVEEQNKRYAQPTTDTKPSALGWEVKLAGVPGGAALDALWRAGKHKEFADAVAELQYDQAKTQKEINAIDGILGPVTWSRLAGLGEAMASLPVVQNTDKLCYMATQRRFEGGSLRATGKAFDLPTGATQKTFDIIISTKLGEIGTVEEKYRGTGAAGALVYSGRGTFVPEADIWAGKLKTGAAMQVWYDADAYKLIRRGTINEKGKERPLEKTDANFFGTSFTFLRYDAAKSDRIWVRHHSGVEWHDKSSWAVWVAANPL